MKFVQAVLFALSVTLFGCAGATVIDCPTCLEMSTASDAGASSDAFDAGADASRPSDLSGSSNADMTCGECVPGTTRQSACDPCSQETCQPNCTWSTCALKPGNACEWRNGNNPRTCNTCGACAGNQYQWCLSSCQWSVQCACCTSGGCVTC